MGCITDDCSYNWLFLSDLGYFINCEDKEEPEDNRRDDNCQSHKSYEFASIDVFSSRRYKEYTSYYKTDETGKPENSEAWNFNFQDKKPYPYNYEKIAPTFILNPVPINPSTIAMIPKTSTPDPRFEFQR